MKKKYVTLCSGGLDSITLAYLLRYGRYEQILLHINYGQKQSREGSYARRCAIALRVPFKVVTLTGAFGSDALTNPDIEVPSGEYHKENLAVTVVPNRNAIFANIAAAVAIANDYDSIALAVHGGDHTLYADCRPEFIRQLENFLCVSTEGGIKVTAPFINWGKDEIVYLAAALKVPFADTWSCYRGGKQHCGTCSTCLERKQAFRLAEVPDYTIYKE